MIETFDDLRAQVMNAETTGYCVTDGRKMVFWGSANEVREKIFIALNSLGLWNKEIGIVIMQNDESHAEMMRKKVCVHAQNPRHPIKEDDAAVLEYITKDL